MTTHDQQLAETYIRLIDTAFAAFALDYRKRMNRPMTAEQWALAKLAFATGFTEGFDEAARVLCEHEEEDDDV